MPEEEFPENIVELIDEILKESNLFEEHERGFVRFIEKQQNKS